MRSLVATLLLSLVAACGSSSNATTDAGAPDAEVVPLDITGKFASELDLDVTADFGANGGVKRSTAQVLAAWAAFERKGDVHPIESAWNLCTLPLPGLGDLPFPSLEAFIIRASGGSLSGDTDGAMLVQPTVSIVVGAVMSHPESAPLPDGSIVCNDTLVTDCVVPDRATNLPGSMLITSGLSPDIDRAYVVARLQFALSATAHTDGTLNGSVTSASLETRVLACHLRGGAVCAPADVAKINAALPSVKIAGGTLRSHAQGSYFVCPQLLADPMGSISGVELQDGGVADFSTPGASEPLSFTEHIQPDLDRLGCATFGCHDHFTGPGQMHLFYLPSTTQQRDNYQQVLPWTVGAAGGRFVNQVPIPADVKARWQAWIAAGASY